MNSYLFSVVIRTFVVIKMLLYQTVVYLIHLCHYAYDLLKIHLGTCVWYEKVYHMWFISL